MVLSLQDDGVVVSSSSKLAKKTGIQKRKYLKIAKIATQIYKKLKETYNPVAGLDGNVSRGMQVLAMEILQSRKHVDTCDTDKAFHQYGNNGKIYIINNCTLCAGVDQAVNNFQKQHEHNAKTRAAHRTPEDGIRLCGVLFKQEYRAAVSGIMKNKKDRKKSDVPGDPTKSFFEKALADFVDIDFNVPTPKEDVWLSEQTDEYRDKWDPNSPSLFEHPRSADWLMDTWYTYVRPRYKKSLDKWNKETGGGDGTPASFIDYCGNDKWLVWIFLLDYETNFLLANNASGRMPNHLQLEAGFDTATLSDITDDDWSSKSRVKTLEKELNEVRRNKEKIDDFGSIVSDFLKTRMGTGSTCQSDTPSKMSYDDCLKKADYYKAQLRELEDDDLLDIELKLEHTQSLKDRRTRFLKAAIEIEKAKRAKHA